MGVCGPPITLRRYVVVAFGEPIAQLLERSSFIEFTDVVIDRRALTRQEISHRI